MGISKAEKDRLERLKKQAATAREAKRRRRDEAMAHEPLIENEDTDKAMAHAAPAENQDLAAMAHVPRDEYEDEDEAMEQPVDVSLGTLQTRHHLGLR